MFRRRCQITCRLIAVETAVNSIQQTVQNYSNAAYMVHALPVRPKTCSLAAQEWLHRTRYALWDYKSHYFLDGVKQSCRSSFGTSLGLLFFFGLVIKVVTSFHSEEQTIETQYSCITSKYRIKRLILSSHLTLKDWQFLIMQT